MSNLGSSMKTLLEFLLYCILFSVTKCLLVGFVSLQQYVQLTYVNKGVAPPSESQIPDPAVTSSDPDNDRLSIIRRPSGIRFYLSYALARTYL